MPLYVTKILNSMRINSNEFLLQNFLEVLKNYEREFVINQLINIIQNGSKEIAPVISEYIYDFPDIRFIEPLVDILKTEGSSEDNVEALR